MMAMMVLPIDPSQTLVVLGGAMPQFKDRQAGVRATDRDSGVLGAPDRPELTGLPRMTLSAKHHQMGEPVRSRESIP